MFSHSLSDLSNEHTFHLVQQLGAALRLRGWIATTAESCTGGLLAGALTAVPGSSTWFNEGFITYANAAKTAVLGVPLALLTAQGAVSTAVVTAMSEGALARTHANLAMAISGIAGPDGGTAEKPVGTVCFAWALRSSPAASPTVHTSTMQFSGDRAQIRQLAVEHALTQALSVVLGRGI
jgi:nicotinamide-nucleotide amidase